MSAEGRGLGVEMVQSCSSFAHSLFRIVATGGALRAKASGYFAARDRPGRGDAHQDGKRKVLVEGSPKPVRESRRVAMLRVLQPFRWKYEPWNALVAGHADALRKEIGTAVECSEFSARAVYAGVLAKRRSDISFC